MSNVNDEQFRDSVRLSIRENSKLDLPYIFMNMLAAVIACYGLLADSPAVVIGAMIVALLLGPIAAVALSLVEGDIDLLKNSLVSLVAGTICVIVTALFLGYIHHDIPITHEIIARTSPNLMDLMVALAGGAAGAYAAVSPRLSTALVGVAIATALVPPLCSGSMLLARGEYQYASGAFLLAFANMVSIQFAASVVLILCGYGRAAEQDGFRFGGFLKRHAISIAVLVILAVVLTSNLVKVARQQIYESSTRTILTRIIDGQPGNHLAEVRFEYVGDKTIIRAVVRGQSIPSAEQVSEIESRLPSPPDGLKSELRIRFVETIIISRSGRITQKEPFRLKE